MDWEKLNVDFKDNKIFHLITDTGSKYNVAMINRKTDSKYYQIILDFSATFKCEVRDYDIYTPGSQIRHQCFLGKEGFNYTKKPTSICSIERAKLPKIVIAPCKCEAEDYLW
ncbi:hypothetical protein RF11_14500 [Thelohanellus kitauei]|uniref:Sortilin C-terminal domain-containing protein n=1 Tax=Thelohanellus kitauei TaxID=669202 RepID=A0A0C2N5A5_THEKT|nr:hypothetical protein RF11_14500 [Thelohanellus kitauei]